MSRVRRPNPSRPSSSRDAAPEPSSAPPRLATLHALFLLSGALGLAYEVLWMRRFSTLFGGTVLASAATLSAFFLGTTAGSLVLGARSRRWRHPLRAFGALEIGVGLSALLVAPILALYGDIYPVLYERLSSSPGAFALAKTLLAVAAVVLPTFCMGGTLPALGEALAAPGTRLGVPVGGLYAANVAGAALGAMSVPFLLLPTMGVRGAERSVILGSLLVGAAALIVGRHAVLPRRASDVLDAPPTGGATPSDRTPSTWTVLVLAGWSGLVTLGLEALWVRALSLVHESSVHSFSIVLVVFLLGLAAGAALARALLGRGAEPRRLLSRAWSVAGVLVVVTPRLLEGLTEGFTYIAADSWTGVAMRLFALAGVVLLPASVALGMALPSLMEMISRVTRASAPASPGPLVGRLLAANMAGAIAGPVLVTFLLAPMVGLWASLVVVGVLTTLLGALLSVSATERVVIGVVTVAALWGGEPWHTLPARVRSDQGERLVARYEGAYGTTTVLESPVDRWITVNNSYILGGAAAAEEERWQGHLPMLLHPAPRRVAFIGTGTGIAAGATLSHPVERLVALEIVPEVMVAAHQHFHDLNAGLVTDPRVTVAIDDGRNFVLAAPPGRFDVVVGDLLVPWKPGESALYTHEHMLEVRRVLAADGLFCQWLPLYQLTDEQLASLIRTFLAVFPRCTMWRGNFLPGVPVVALVGHQRPTPLDVDRIDQRVAALSPTVVSANPMLAHPAGLWLSLVGAPSPRAGWIARAPVNTDDEPWVELHRLDRAPTLAGARLEGVYDRVATGSLAGTPLESLAARHRAWWQLGRELGRAALDRGPRGEAQVRELLGTLPEPLRQALYALPEVGASARHGKRRPTEAAQRDAAQSIPTQRIGVPAEAPP